MYQVVCSPEPELGHLPEVQTTTQNQSPKPMTHEEIPISEIPTLDDLDLSHCFGEKLGFCERNK